jgi:hypothetical protein
MSGMTPANAVWFALDAGMESDEERRWLDEAATFLWESIHAANYDAAKFECGNHILLLYCKCER